MAIQNTRQAVIITVFILLSFAKGYAQKEKLFKIVTILYWFIVLPAFSFGQKFERISIEEMHIAKKISFREIVTTSKGEMLIAASSGIAEINGGHFNFTFPTGGLIDANGNQQSIGSSSNLFKDEFELHTGYKTMAVGPDNIIYVVSDNNNMGFIDYKLGKVFGMPPFNFPNNIDIRKIWVDKDGDLFIAAADSFYIIKEATKIYDTKKKEPFVTEGVKKIEKFSLGKNILPYCFAEDSTEDIIYIGTNHGLFEFEKKTGIFYNLFKEYKQNPVTITQIRVAKNSSDIWFSTLENGMGNYNLLFKTATCYPYKKYTGPKNPIANFTGLSGKEFLVAASDSLPAIFNTENTSYQFIDDTSFIHTKNTTTDIQVGAGNLVVLIKDGYLFISKNFLKDRPVNNTGFYIGPYIKEILVGGTSYKEKMNYYGRYDSLKKIQLPYYENNIDIEYAAKGTFFSDTLVFAWKLEGKFNQWNEVPYTFLDERINMIQFDNLKPGKYILRVRLKKDKGDWLKEEVQLTIIIEPPFWQTWWFWLLVITGISLLTYLIVKWRVNTVRKQERERARHEKELSELEAKALRAQMNPHFIFNCLNSIKSLIQQHEEEKSVNYLTTFSKLIRTLVNNSDKKDISLNDEIDTCKLYLQLEAMRFNAQFSYSVKVDENLDLKSVQVPALIIQPFIENAIWHGIVPKGEAGHVELSVTQKDGVVEITVDDNGIGRETSQQNKSASGLQHKSKGITLTKSRLELDNLLRQRQAKLEIIDKKDEQGLATGTKIIITLNEEQS